MTWDTSTRRARLPRGWSKLRVRILKRDGYICHVCHRPGADEVDHVKAGDDHRESNLAAIHNTPCHKNKTAREATTARSARPTRHRKPEQHPGMR